MMRGWLPFKMLSAARVSVPFASERWFPHAMLRTTQEIDVHVPCDGPSCKVCKLRALAKKFADTKDKIVIDSLRGTDAGNVDHEIDERIARHFPIRLERSAGGFRSAT